MCEDWKWWYNLSSVPEPVESDSLITRENLMTLAELGSCLGEALAVPSLYVLALPSEGISSIHHCSRVFSKHTHAVLQMSMWTISFCQREKFSQEILKRMEGGVLAGQCGVEGVVAWVLWVLPGAPGPEWARKDMWFQSFSGYSTILIGLGGPENESVCSSSHPSPCHLMPS